MSLRRRLVLAAAYLLTVVVVALEVPLALTVSSNDNRAFQARLLSYTALVASRINDDVAAFGSKDPALPDPGGTIASVARLTAQQANARFVVTDKVGLLLADSAGEGRVGDLYATPDRPEFQQVFAVPGGTLPDIRERFSDTADGDLLLITVPVIHDREAIGAVRGSAPLAAERSQVHRAWLGLALIGLIVVIVGLALAWFLATSIVRPVERLQGVALELGGGDLGARASPEGPREVATLAGSFNQMAGALSANINAQRDFVANASHQLRTPLTGLRLRLEAIQADGGEAGAQAAKAEGEVDRLASLVDGLLRLASASSVKSAGVRLDMAGAARAAIDRWTEAAVRHGKTLRVGRCEETSVFADPADLAHVVDNLIENAIRYAPDGATVTVEAGAPAGRPTLTVADDGPGIPEEDRERVFERFYRGATGRRAGRGTGLGLAIVSELVQKWGGEVRLAAGPGTRFEVRLPPAPTLP